MGTHKPQTPEDERIIDQVQEQTESLSEQPGAQPEQAKRSAIGRREAIGKLGIIGAGILATFIGAGSAEAGYHPTDVPNKNVGGYVPEGESLPTSAEMLPEEVERMNYTQEIIHRHFIDPGFLIYLRQCGKFNSIIPALETAIQYRKDLIYKEIGNGLIEIKKRPNSQNENIPANFKIVISTDAPAGEERKTGRGFIVRVNTTDMPAGTLHDAEFNENYESFLTKINQDVIPIYRDHQRNKKLLKKRLESPNLSAEARQTINNKLQQEYSRDALFDKFRKSGVAKADVEEILMTCNKVFPRQLLRLVHLRGLGDEALLAQLQAAVQTQGEDYDFEDYVRQSMDNASPILFVVYKEFPGMYFLWLQEGDLPIGISAEGLIEQKDLNTGGWNLDPLYGDEPMQGIVR